MKPKTPQTMADRFCNAWSWLGMGVISGFTACNLLVEKGYNPMAINMIYWIFVVSLGTFVIELPRAILEISRLVAKHRRLAS